MKKHSVKWQVNVAISDGHQKMVLIRNGEEKEVVYVYRMLGFVMYSDSDGNECQYHMMYRDGGTVEEVGEPVTAWEFSHDVFESFKIFIDGQQLKSDAILRVGFYAMTDVGTILFSFYPTLKTLARPWVMFFSDKSRDIAFAQHISTAWLGEMLALE